MGFKVLLVVTVFLVVAHAQFGQYPPNPQFGDSPFTYPFQQHSAGINPFRPGPYQLKSQFPPPPPPPMPHPSYRFNPFDNVFNEEGDKLTCRMVCGPAVNDTTEDVEELKPEKKESGENNIEKKDG